MGVEGSPRHTPPELILLPTWSPVNIYDFASWARATIVPLLILLDRKPVRPVPDRAQVDELYPHPRSDTDYSISRPKRLVGWESLFYAGGIVLRQLEKLPWKPTRGQAIKRAERWILEHQEADGSWGGIQPPWVYSLMALSSLGYPTEHPIIVKGLAGFETFAIEERATMRVQACVSALWDTSLAMIALLDSGFPPDHPALVRSAEWLLEEQVLTGGDWQVRARGVPAGGWAFEFHNDGYPDLDDTAEIVMALNRVEIPVPDNRGLAVERAVAWILGMQSHNGGWAAFGETIDPPSVDVTAHVLEMLGQLGFDRSNHSVAKALDYVLRDQEEDGAWFGRWGVNYIYGVGAVLPALKALGFDMNSEPVSRAVQWLIGHQNPDGGWGESCSSYVDPTYRGRGASTPSQTAWALIAMLASGYQDHPATQRGIHHLIGTQQRDGTWDERHYTGTGFPGYGTGQRRDRYPTPDDPGYQEAGLPAGFMINYHLYRKYWPLTALGRYRMSVAGTNGGGEGPPSV